jgi:voltage-gated potassium channel
MIEFFTLLRLARSVGSTWRRDPQFRSLVYLVLITLLAGTIFYSLVEGWSVVDALYFSVTTLTTVGFGDRVPYPQPLQLLIRHTVQIREG